MNIYRKFIVNFFIIFLHICSNFAYSSEIEEQVTYIDLFGKLIQKDIPIKLDPTPQVFHNNETEKSLLKGLKDIGNSLIAQKKWEKSSFQLRYGWALNKKDNKKYTLPSDIYLEKFLPDYGTNLKKLILDNSLIQTIYGDPSRVDLKTLVKLTKKIPIDYPYKSDCDSQDNNYFNCKLSKIEINSSFNKINNNIFSGVGMIISTASFNKDRMMLTDGIVSDLESNEYKLCKNSKEHIDKKIVTNDTCTGFLIKNKKGKQALLTARHCIDGKTEDKLKVIFGYNKYDDNELNYVKMPKKHVFGVKKIIRSTNPKLDYAFLLLDREVNEEVAIELEIEHQLDLKVGTLIAIAGYPNGSSLKIDISYDYPYEPTILRPKEPSKKNYFYVSTDTNKGDSGAPIFSVETSKVVGMLVSGESDFVYTTLGDEECVISNRIKIDNNISRLGEKVLNLRTIPLSYEGEQRL